MEARKRTTLKEEEGFERLGRARLRVSDGLFIDVDEVVAVVAAGDVLLLLSESRKNERVIGRRFCYCCSARET